MVLSIRPYEPGDEEAICNLFRECFGRTMSSEWWRWRFRQNPVGQGLVYLAWDNEVLSAHYAVTRVPLLVDRNEVLSGLAGTTMTHPKYRSAGLFPLLACATYDTMATVGIPLVWGFPNINAHRGLVHGLGWRDVYEIPTFRWMLPSEKRLPSSLDCAEEVDDVDSRFDRLWDKMRLTNSTMVRRDSEYLRWRYIKNPVDTYRILVLPEGDDICAYIVLKRYGQEIQIVDILGDVPGCVHLVLCAASLARGEGLPSVSMWLNTAHPLHRRLEGLQFRNDAPVTYMVGLITIPGRLSQSVYSYRDWHITMGDSDVY